MSDEFTILRHQVPEPPTGKRWADHLRWMLCVMDTDDEAMAFVSSVLSYAIKNEGISQRQSKACNKILDRLLARYWAGRLDCQNSYELDEEPQESTLDDSPIPPGEKLQ